MEKFLIDALTDNPEVFPDRYYLSIQSDSVKGSENKVDEEAVEKELGRVSDIIKDDLFPSLPKDRALRYLYTYPELFMLIVNYYSVPEILAELPQFIFYQTKYPIIKEFLSEDMIFPEDETNINYITTQLIEQSHEEYLMKYWAKHPTIVTWHDEECEITKLQWKISNPYLREAFTQYHLITFESNENQNVMFEFIRQYLTPGDIFTLCLNHITTEYYDELCSLIPNMLNIQKFFPKNPIFPEYQNRSMLLKFKEHLEKNLGNTQLVDTLRIL